MDDTPNWTWVILLYMLVAIIVGWEGVVLALAAGVGTYALVRLLD